MRWRLLAISIVLLIAAISANVVAEHFGGAWIWAAGCLTGGFLVGLMALGDMPPSYIGNFQLGEWGEKATAKALKPLLRNGWEVLHDLQHDYGNIDHVVVGPSGIYLLDSKWVVGQAEVTEDGLRVRRWEDNENTYIHHENLGSRMRRAAADLHDRVQGKSRINHFVQAVVVVHGGFAGPPQQVNSVTYLSGDQLEAYLRGQQPALTSDRAQQIAAVIFSAYPDPRDDRLASTAPLGR